MKADELKMITNGIYTHNQITIAAMNTPVLAGNGCHKKEGK